MKRALQRSGAERRGASRDEPRRPRELITASGAAEIIGVSAAAVSNYRARGASRARPAFPDPWFEIGPVVLYVRAEIEVWAADRAARTAERAAARVARLETDLAAARAAARAIGATGARKGT